MNSGVSIDPRSTAVHGFTTVAVARSAASATTRRGARCAHRADAVLVCHTGSDIRVLRCELERLDEAKAAGDTGVTVGSGSCRAASSTQPCRAAAAAGVGQRGVVSLASLCQLVGVSNTQAHHAGPTPSDC